MSVYGPMTVEVTMQSWNDYYKRLGGLAHDVGIIYNLGSYQHWIWGDDEDEFESFKESLIEITEHEFLHCIGYRILGRYLTHDEIDFILGVRHSAFSSKT